MAMFNVNFLFGLVAEESLALMAAILDLIDLTLAGSLLFDIFLRNFYGCSNSLGKILLKLLQAWL